MPKIRCDLTLDLKSTRDKTPCFHSYPDLNNLNLIPRFIHDGLHLIHYTGLLNKADKIAYKLALLLFLYLAPNYLML